MGAEWTQGCVIVPADYECINLALLSLQELLSPTGMTLYNCEWRTESDHALLLLFDMNQR